jgi:hypothetical protein
MMKTALTAALILLAGVSHAAAQPQGTDPAPPQNQRSDRAVDLTQPDFTLIGLPTTLRMPRFASAFRVTHRFNRPLGGGDFGDLASDLFSLDSGAQIGLEYRFGIMAGTQIGIHRTSNRTIEFFAQHQLLRQGTRTPIGLDVFATAEGTNNFRDSYSPAIGVVISRTVARRLALYLHPMWINNTNALPSELIDENDTSIIGIGGRLRVLPTVYFTVESAPRFGFKPDYQYVSFAIEKRAGGHLFQLNFSNGPGTTLAQMARGGISEDDWYLGFNISRKFF